MILAPQYACVYASCPLCTWFPLCSGPAAVPRKPIRDRAKTFAPAGEAGTGHESSAKAPVTVPEENAGVEGESEDNLYAEVTSPSASLTSNDTAASTSQPLSPDKASNASAEASESDKHGDEHAEKADSKAGKKSLTSRFGQKFGKLKKHTPTESEVHEEATPVVNTAPAPEVPPPKPPASGNALV